MNVVRTRKAKKDQEETMLFGPDKRTEKAVEKYDKRVKASTKKH